MTGQPDGRLSGKRFNRLVETMVKRFDEKVAMLVEHELASGYPPFTVPLTPLEQYQKLVAMQQAGDPAYTEDPRAQAALAKLAVRFGPPPPISGASPFPMEVAAKPSAELGAGLTSARLGAPPIFGGPPQ